MAQVQIFDLGAVLQGTGCFVGDLAAARGAGSENALHIGAGSVTGKPDTPDYVHRGVFITDDGHSLIGDIAGIHIQCFEVLHKRNDLPDSGAFIIHGNMTKAEVGV